MNAFNIFELDILLKIRELFQNPVMDFLMPAISLFGEAGIFWIAVSLLMMALKKYRRTGFEMGLALLIGVIIVNVVIKNAAARIRPYDLENGIKSLSFFPYHDYSFPSGHSLACFEAALPLLWRDKKLGIPALIIAVLVCFSRVYIGVHYPSDVIAGVILGITFAYISKFIVGFAYKKYEAFKAEKAAQNENKNS